MDNILCSLFFVGCCVHNHLLGLGFHKCSKFEHLDLIAATSRRTTNKRAACGEYLFFSFIPF